MRFRLGHPPHVRTDCPSAPSFSHTSLCILHTLGVLASLLLACSCLQANTPALSLPGMPSTGPSMAHSYSSFRSLLQSVTVRGGPPRMKLHHITFGALMELIFFAYCLLAHHLSLPLETRLHEDEDREWAPPVPEAGLTHS